MRTATRGFHAVLRSLAAAFASALVLADAPHALAQDSDQPRLYMGVRIGESNPITKTMTILSRMPTKN